jgi:circadian clock protein KaiB
LAVKRVFGLLPPGTTPLVTAWMTTNRGDEGRRVAVGEVTVQVSTYSFRLYVAGGTARAQAAERNLHRVCENHLAGDYQVEVVDVRHRPDLAAQDRVMATPTVLRLAPSPQLRVIGELSDLERTAAFLGLPDHSRPREGR